jgi:hypothetical protein
LENIIGKRNIKVVRNGERPGGQPEWPGNGTLTSDRTKLRDRAIPAEHQDVLASLDTVEPDGGVTLKFLQGNGTHVRIVAGHTQRQRSADHR